MKTQRETPIIIIRRKKRGHAGHHGGAWKVAFADFMTAMMALFLVLWLVTQSPDVKVAIAGYFQDPMGSAKEIGKSVIKGERAMAVQVRALDERAVAEARRQERLANLAEKIKESLPHSVDAGRLAAHVVIEIVPEGLRISMVEDSSTVFFSSGSPVPLPATVELLTGLGLELAKVDAPFVVDGHTDATPFANGGAYSNWELSADRANAARRLLVAGGVPAERIAEVRGMADREPRMADRFAPQNRRVTVLLRIPSLPVDTTAHIAAAP